MRKHIRIVFLALLLVIFIGTILMSLNRQRSFIKSRDLPTQTIKLDNTNYKLLYNYTKIDWIHWRFTSPVYKVKELNPYDAYFVLDESQTVIVDLDACIRTSSGKIYVNDTEKIPNDFHSDKICAVTISQFTLDLTKEEMQILEKMCCDPDDYTLLEEQPDFYLEEGWPKLWTPHFYIDGLEGLSYCDLPLAKASNGDYYIMDNYRGAIAKVPENIALKIDKAFEENSVEF